MTAAAMVARRIGIIGAGKSGTAIARQALAAGYEVRIATSGPAERTALVTSILTPGAVATDVENLVEDSDLIVLAVPLRRFRDLPLAALANRLVIDVMNYWRPVDGVLPEFEGERASSIIVRDALPPTTRLVKALNHIGYHDIEELARPSGDPDQITVGVSGDDTAAVATVTQFVDRLGFDPVIIGGLDTSAVLQPGSVVFGANLDRAAFYDGIAGADVRPAPVPAAGRSLDA